MRLEHIALDQLKPSPLNVRKKSGKDVGDLTASIRSLGLLQPLLVRPNTARASTSSQASGAFVR